MLGTILNLSNLVYTLDTAREFTQGTQGHGDGHLYSPEDWSGEDPRVKQNLSTSREQAAKDAVAYKPGENRESKGPHGKYAFPINITNYDYIRYECKPYQDFILGNTRNEEQAVLYLPMPAELNEQLEAGWGAQDDWLKRNVKYLSKQALESIKTEFTKGVGKTSIVEDIVGMVAGAFGGGGVGQRTIERRRGRIVNPVSEQFFTGMSHRTWEFVHKLVAESHEEAIRLDRIINIFKSASSAKLGGGDYFLNYPLHWDVRFMMGSEGKGKMEKTNFADKDNPYLPKLNTCAITQIATNFSGAGAWASHIDGSPVEIDLTLSLTELVIPTAANFAGQAGKKIGELADVGWESKQLKENIHVENK